MSFKTFHPFLSLASGGIAAKALSKSSITGRIFSQQVDIGIFAGFGFILFGKTFIVNKISLSSLPSG